MKKIKVISYFCPENNINKRFSNSAQEEIIKFILNILQDLDYNIDIISPSEINYNKNNKFYNTEKIKINDNINFIGSPCFDTVNPVLHKINVLLSWIWLSLYLIFNCKNNETIIVYHAIDLINIIKLVKKIKNIKIFMLVEEIYSDVSKLKRISKEKELSYLKTLDAYLFPTVKLNELINVNNKPYIISYGAYNLEKKYNVSFNDNKIHIVYAGTFDPNKGGVYNAIQSCKYLDKKYCMHILGFGTDANIKQVKNEINNNNTNVDIIYEGLLKGEDYNKFLQKCHIGLSSQTPVGEYNNTSFPSKILKYMANSLHIVSIDIPVVRETPVSEYISFYKENTPEALGNAIKNVDLNSNINMDDVINDLYNSSKVKINNILEYLK